METCHIKYKYHIPDTGRRVEPKREPRTLPFLSEETGADKSRMLS